MLFWKYCPYAFALMYNTNIFYQQFKAAYGAIDMSALFNIRNVLVRVK